MVQVELCIKPDLEVWQMSPPVHWGTGIYYAVKVGTAASDTQQPQIWDCIRCNGLCFVHDAKLTVDYEKKPFTFADVTKPTCCACCSPCVMKSSWLFPQRKLLNSMHLNNMKGVGGSLGGGAGGGGTQRLNNIFLCINRREKKYTLTHLVCPII